MRKITLLCCAILCTVFSKAQVTGIKTIGVDYPTIAAAVTALNTTGVGAGGATINVPTGYTETAPAGGFVLGTTLLNASLSAANPLVFQKSGAGANPVLTAFTGGSSTTSDGVFKLLGTDYVTIDGINIKENAGNTLAALMEWGYALVNLNAAAPFDGCQFVTIKNCSVTLDRTNPNGSFGIYSAHNIATNTTALTLTAVGDLHSNNKFYTNTISNINEGIWVAGFAAASPYTLYDQNNDVGGGSLATGNTVTNGGGNATFNFFGVYLANQNGANGSYNTINNASGGVGNNTNTYGVYFFGTNSSANATNNNVVLTQASGAFSIYGIYPGNTGATVVSNNTIQELTSGATTSTFYHVYLPNTAVSETVSNNIFSNSNINTTGTVYLIYASNSTPPVTVTNNSIAGTFAKTGAGSTVYGYYNFGSPAGGTATITGNNFSGVTLTGSTSFYGIYQASTTSQIENVNNNTISNITGGSGTTVGIYHSYGAVGSTANNNTVTNITSIGIINGMSIGTSSAGLGGSFSGNNINTLSSTGGAFTVTGILHTGGTNSSIFKNKIYNLSSSNASGVTNGITIAAATTAINIYNNLIGDLRAPLTSSATDAVRGINITSATATSNLNIYYNTVVLNAVSSGANFSSSGLFHTFNTTATTAALDLRNNIIVNNSTPNGTGIISAIRRSAATNLNNFATTSNNNLLFAGGACASKFIYYDGTTGYQTLAAYKAFVTPRDALAVSEDPKFLSTAGANAGFLHINTAIATQVESAGASIATYLDDYDGDVRTGTPDIGADEFTGTIAVACAGTPTAGTATAASGTICSGSGTSICLSGQTAAAGITYQWQSAPAAGGPFAPIACANSSCYNTVNLATGTYYYNCVITCSNGGASSTSNVVTIVVNPTPVVTINPPAPTICNGFSTPLTASGAATYTWSPATGLSATTGTTVTASPTTTTTYSVIGVDAVGCTSAATNSIVTVNAVPVLATSTATPAVICVGSNSQLQAGPAAPSAYCTGAYTTGTGLGDYIINVTLGTINNTTGASAAPYYTYYNALNTNLTAGSAYTITGTLANGGTEDVAVWIDYNQNGVFEASEKIGEQASLSFSLPFTVPAGTLNGVTRMRVMNVYNTTGILPCGSYTYGEIEDYNVTITGGGSYTYLWSPATFLSSTTIANPIATGVTVTTTYTAKVTAANGCFSTNTVTVTIDPVAYAVTGGGSYCTSGAGLPVGLAGSQTGVTYQLKLNGATNVGAPVAGTGAAISFGNQTAGTYTVVATNTTTTCSNNMTGSAIIALYPVVTVTPTLTQPTTCVSTDGAISIALSGAPGPYTFAWTGNGVVVAAQNQTNLTAGSYTVVVTDGNGCSTSTFIGLTGPGGCSVCPTLGAVTTNPTPSGCIGANITLTASGLTSMGVTYGVTFKSYTAATADPYTGGTVLATVPNAGLTAGGTVATATGTFAAANTYFIYAILTPTPIDIGCRPSAVTNFVINPTPTVTATPASQTICSGGTITTIVNSGSAVAGTVYNWTRDNTATVTGIAANGTGNISGALTNNTAAPITVTFTITPTANGCPGTPVTATVLVNPTTTVVATPASQTICSGSNVVPIVLTGVAGTTFTWTRNNTATVPGGIPASGSGSTISGFMINTTSAPVTVTFTITPTANGCPGTPTTATVIVNPFASATATPATQTACSGSAITTIALTSNVAGVTYAWTRDNTATATGIAASGTGNIAGALTLVGTAQVTVTFTITPSFGGCPGPAITASVTINPTPTVNQPANQTLCNGSTAAATAFTGSLTGAIYSWTNNTPSIGLAASGTGDIAAFTATNAGIAPVTATITVTPSLNGCTGTPKTFTITVNPTATVNAVGNQTLCTGAATTAVTFAGTVAGTTYSWTNNTTSIGLAASGTGNIASFTATNATPTAVTATITVTPTAAGCAGTPKTFTITVNGQSVAPTGAIASKTALCGAGTADLTVQGGALGTGASWKWYSGSCGGTLIGTGSTITSVPVNGTATFYVRAEGTCNTTACASVTVTVNPQPTITLSASPFTSLMFPMTTGITANITPSAASNTIVWYKDGIVIPGAATNVLSGITVDQLGTYTARATTQFGCTALSAPLVIKDSASDKLFILPNPNNGQFKIRYYTNRTNFGFLRRVIIYDSKGAQIYNNAIPITGPYSAMDIDIRQSGHGLFLVVVADYEGKKLVTAKVEVQ